MHMEALGRLKRSAPHLEFPALHKELFSVDSWAQTGNQLISTPNTIENDDNSTYYYNSSSIIKSTTPTTIINASTILQQQQQPQTSIIFLTSSSSTSSFLKSDTTNVSDSINISTSPDNEINYFSTSTPSPSAPVVDTSVVQQTETLSPSSTSSDYHQHNNTITMIL